MAELCFPGTDLLSYSELPGPNKEVRENMMLEQPPGHLFGSETRFQQNWLPGWHEV